MPDAREMPLRLLAVVDSESFLKWAASTIGRLAADGLAVDGRAVTIKGPLEPSPAQVTAAVAGTPITDAPVVTRRALSRLVERQRPDAVLIGATGPIAEMIALTVLRASGGYRPALLSGPPGMALSPASAYGVRWRQRWCDAYIVHSPRETALFRDAFARYGAHPRMVLSRLPFLAQVPRVGPSDTPVTRVVFAPQSTTPHARTDRVTMLRGLARLQEQGYDVVVKLRTRAGEQQTHYEALPYRTLWEQEHERLGHSADDLRFETGPLSDWLVPGTALVTVSSTAALESLAVGLPTAVVVDFGISAELANEVYDGSGCMVRLDDLPARLRERGPVVDPGWLAANYLHDTPSELGPTLEQLAAERLERGLPPVRSRRPVNPLVHLYSAIKSDIPALWLPARWARAVLGRFTALR